MKFIELDEFYKEEAIENRLLNFMFLLIVSGSKAIGSGLQMHWKLRFVKAMDSAIVETTKTKTSYSDRFDMQELQHIEYNRPDPRILSFNNPYGACPRCQGFGNIMELDENKIIPDPSLTLGRISDRSMEQLRIPIDVSHIET